MTTNKFWEDKILEWFNIVGYTFQNILQDHTLRSVGPYTIYAIVTVP